MLYTFAREHQTTNVWIQKHSGHLFILIEEEGDWNMVLFILENPVAFSKYIYVSLLSHYIDAALVSYEGLAFDDQNSTSYILSTNSNFV